MYEGSCWSGTWAAALFDDAEKTAAESHVRRDVEEHVTDMAQGVEEVRHILQEEGVTSFRPDKPENCNR